MKSKNWIFVTTISTLITASLVTAFMVFPVIASAEHYYAGYYYYGYEDSPPPNGVSADIYTIDSWVTGANFYCQWPSVMLSYRYMYWIQVGYNKGYDTNFALKWYIEKIDQNGYEIRWKNSPLSYNTYHYYLYRSSGQTYWRVGVSGQFEDIIQPYPYLAIDYQAFSETTTADINIDGTHFTYISYAQGSDWRLWDQHYPRADPPYKIQEMSNYEFTASGGGPWPCQG